VADVAIERALGGRKITISTEGALVEAAEWLPDQGCAGAA